MVDFALMNRKMAAAGREWHQNHEINEFPRVVVDFETRSIAKLGDKDSVGAHKYAEHPSTRILCLGYKIGNEPAQIWLPGTPFPQRLIDLIEFGAIFEAHNAGFEKAIWRAILVPMGIPYPTKWMDTMAACAYRALPMKLEAAGAVLDLPIQKNKRGKDLIRKLCVPQKLTKADIKAGLEYPKWCNDPALLDELYTYCKDDCDSEKCLGDAIGDLPGPEYDVWCLDQTINNRGVYIDVEAVKAASVIRDTVVANLTNELQRITNNRVGTVDERDKIIAWAEEQGFRIPDMTADTLVLLLGKENMNPPPDNVRRVLEIRQALGRSSVKKLDKFLLWRCMDGRLYGLLAYHGASTGRWAGRGVQPQNFPRGDDSILGEAAWLGKRHNNEPGVGMGRLIEAIRTGDSDLVELLYGDPMEAISSALRGFIIAEPGNELFVADFSAIEARVLSWVAGEQWKLDAFAGIDRGEGYKGSQDIYLATASMVFGYPCLTKKTHHKERATGKVCELAFGYQGGVGAWRNFDSSDKWTDEEVDAKKKAWRAAHPMTVRLWYGLEEAAVNAVMSGRACRYRGVTFQVVKSKVGPWLACRLPNGRCLWYYNPMVEETGTDYITGLPKYQVSYEGKDNKRGGAWARIRTYGGMLTENVVQAISRDLMVEAMFRVEAAGYPIILTVHDEVIAERKKRSGGDIKQFNALMSVVPPWCKGIPLAVAGWVGDRYLKD